MTPRSLFAIVVLGSVLLGPTASVARAEERTAGPDLRALDGTLAETRTAASVSQLRSERATVSAWWEGEFLHVAVKSEPIVVASVCLAHDDRVQVLHASAALGSVEYVRGDPSWSLHGTFDWKVRDKTMSAAALEERQRYLDINGWVATTVEMGKPGQTEYVIAARLVPPGTRFTAALMEAAKPNGIVEIHELATGCNSRKLVAGPPPDQLKFAPATWPEAPKRNGDILH